MNIIELITGPGRLDLDPGDIKLYENDSRYHAQFTLERCDDVNFLRGTPNIIIEYWPFSLTREQFYVFNENTKLGRFQNDLMTRALERGLSNNMEASFPFNRVKNLDLSRTCDYMWDFQNCIIKRNGLTIPGPEQYTQRNPLSLIIYSTTLTIYPIRPDEPLKFKYKILDLEIRRQKIAEHLSSLDQKVC